MAPLTEKGYACDWRTFREWCRRAKLRSLPASPETLSLFLADQLVSKKVVTVRRYAAGVAYKHSREGYPSPLDDSVRRTLRGASRMRAEQPRQMHPLSVAQLRKVVTVLKKGERTPAVVRNQALLVAGFASALRASNLVALRFEDLTFCPEGVLLLIRREKQNREGGAGRTVALPYGKHRTTCPVRTLKDWLKIRGRSEGALFGRLDHGMAGTELLNRRSLIGIVKRCVAAAGIDESQYSPHSLRSGLITAAGIAGVSALVVGEHVGHKSPESTARYFRPANRFRMNCAGMVGL
jgi:integrase